MTEFTGSNYFLNIPAKVAHDTRFSSYRTVVIFGEINSILNVNSKCFISNSKLAKRINCSERSIQRSIKELKDLGYINTVNIVDPETGAIINREISFTQEYISGKLFESVTTQTTNQTGGTRQTGRKPGVTVGDIKEQYKKNNIKDIYSPADRSAEPSRPSNKKSKSDKSSDHDAIYKQVIDYLNLKAGTSYQPTAIKTRSLIDTILAHGYTINDIFKVIDLKAFEWQGDRMFMYMRPSTLFNFNHFQEYLNGVPANRVKPVKRKEPTVNELKETHKRNFDAQQRNSELLINPDTGKPFKTDGERQLYLNSLFNDLETGGN